MNITGYYNDYLHCIPLEPHNVHESDNWLFQFYAKYLLQKTFALFKFTLPKEWQDYGESYFKYVLFLMGYIAIVRTPQFGVIPQYCTLRDYGIFLQPLDIIVSNRYLQIEASLDGNDAALIRMSPDYTGIGDIFGSMASLLANTHGAIPVNIANSKLAAVFGANTQNLANSFKAMYDDIQNGNSAIFVSKELFKADGELNVSFFNNNIKNTFIVPELLESLKTIEQWYFSFIGIPNTNTGKKERLNVDETNKNDISTQCLLDTWFDQINANFKTVNEKFGLDLKVEKRYQGGYNDSQDKSTRVDEI